MYNLRNHPATDSGPLLTLNPRPNPALMSVAASEIRKNLEHEIRMEIEYLLSEEGLRQEPDVAKVVKESPTASVPFEILLKMEKMKTLGITKEDILHAISESEYTEINGDGTGIKRRGSDKIRVFEPSISKKRKTGQNNGVKVQENGSLFNPKLYKITLVGGNASHRESIIKKELEKTAGVSLAYLRLRGNQGYFAIEPSNLTEADIAKLAHLETKLHDVEVKIQECWDDDLDNFYKMHGKHLDSFLERSGRRRKQTDTKDEVDLLFYNKKFVDIAPLEYMFNGILSKNLDGEIINQADHQLLRELITYHDDFKKLSRDIRHFTVGTEGKGKAKKCFYAVQRDGEEIPFTFEECRQNLEAYYMDAREDIEVKDGQGNKK